MSIKTCIHSHFLSAIEVKQWSREQHWLITDLRVIKNNCVKTQHARLWKIEHAFCVTLRMSTCLGDFLFKERPEIWRIQKHLWEKKMVYAEVLLQCCIESAPCILFCTGAILKVHLLIGCIMTECNTTRLTERFWEQHADCISRFDCDLLVPLQSGIIADLWNVL